MTGPAQTIARNLEEVLTREDLEHLVASGTPLRHYIGFEISGKIHLGTGLVCMAKVKDFVEAGVDCTIFLAGLAHVDQRQARRRPRDDPPHRARLLRGGAEGVVPLRRRRPLQA